MSVPRRHSSDLVVFLCFLVSDSVLVSKTLPNKERLPTNVKRLKSNRVQGLMEPRYYSRKMSVYSSVL